MHTASMTLEPGDEQRPATRVVRIADPNRTHLQVQTLLKIIESSEKILANVIPVGESQEFDAEAVKTSRKTHELAHLQLRGIIDDQDRWSLNASDGDRYLENVAKQQADVARDQQENLALLRRPHRRYEARLRFFPTAGWVAWIGGAVPMQTDLHGVGDSPEAAFQAFDMNFVAKESRAKTPAEPPAEPPPAPKPSRRKTKKK